MARKLHSSIYFADDKDIGDLLYDARQKINHARLMEIAFSRGILIGSSTKREDMIEYLARLPYNWQQFVALSQLTDSPDKQDRYSSDKVSLRLSRTEAEELLKKLAEDRSSGMDEVWQVTTEGAVTKAFVKYSEIDRGRNRLSQKVHRECEIEIHTLPDEDSTIRYQSQDRCNKIVDELKGEIRRLRPGSAISSVDLSSVISTEVINKFFLSVMQGLDGCVLVDVRSVRGRRFDTSDKDTEEEVDEEGAPDMTKAIREIALQGRLVQRSAEYSAFFTNDFHINSVVWISSLPDKSQVEFDAGFTNRNRTGFAYSARRQWKIGKRGTLLKGSTRIEPSEKRQLLQRIETAARSAFDALLSELGTASP